VEERTADQRTRCQRDQGQQQPLQRLLAEHEGERSDERDQAHQDAAAQYPVEGVHTPMLPPAQAQSYERR